MSLEVIGTDLPDVLLLRPRVFADERGCFFESFNARAFALATGADITFVQDNQSLSRRHVLRGLHYQVPPAAQAKLVRVAQGEIFDVAVDIRAGSKTFGQWTGRVLSAENRLQMWIPEGFAHGFLVLSDQAEVLYKTNRYYSPECERTLLWNDPAVAVAWPLTAPPILSAKDAVAAPLAAA